MPTGSLPAAVSPAPAYYSSNAIAPVVPGALVAPGTAPVVPGALVSPGTAEQMNPAYNFSLPAAPPRDTAVSQPPPDSDDIVVSFAK